MLVFTARERSPVSFRHIMTSLVRFRPSPARASWSTRGPKIPGTCPSQRHASLPFPPSLHLNHYLSHHSSCQVWRRSQRIRESSHPSMTYPANHHLGMQPNRRSQQSGTQRRDKFDSPEQHETKAVCRITPKSFGRLSAL